MSMLLGVRGSGTDNERHEGIIQKPSPYFNGHPSSLIWGNPPTPPLWRTSILATSYLSSAASAAPVSSICSSSGSEVNDSLWPDQQQHINTWKDEKELSRATATFRESEPLSSSSSRLVFSPSCFNSNKESGCSKGLHLSEISTSNLTQELKVTGRSKNGGDGEVLGCFTNACPDLKVPRSSVEGDFQNVRKSKKPLHSGQGFLPLFSSVASTKGSGYSHHIGHTEESGKFNKHVEKVSMVEQTSSSNVSLAAAGSHDLQGSDCQSKAEGIFVFGASPLLGVSTREGSLQEKGTQSLCGVQIARLRKAKPKKLCNFCSIKSKEIQFIRQRTSKDSLQDNSATCGANMCTSANSSAHSFSHNIEDLASQSQQGGEKVFSSEDSGPDTSAAIYTAGIGTRVLPCNFNKDLANQSEQDGDKVFSSKNWGSATSPAEVEKARPLFSRQERSEGPFLNEVTVPKNWGEAVSKQDIDDKRVPPASKPCKADMLGAEGSHNVAPGIDVQEPLVFGRFRPSVVEVQEPVVFGVNEKKPFVFGALGPAVVKLQESFVFGAPRVTVVEVQEPLVSGGPGPSANGTTMSGVGSIPHSMAYKAAAVISFSAELRDTKTTSHRDSAIKECRGGLSAKQTTSSCCSNGSFATSNPFSSESTSVKSDDLQCSSTAPRLLVNGKQQFRVLSNTYRHKRRSSNQQMKKSDTDWRMNKSSGKERNSFSVSFPPCQETLGALSSEASLSSVEAPFSASTERMASQGEKCASSVEAVLCNLSIGKEKEKDNGKSVLSGRLTDSFDRKKLDEQEGVESQTDREKRNIDGQGQKESKLHAFTFCATSPILSSSVHRTQVRKVHRGNPALTSKLNAYLTAARPQPSETTVGANEAASVTLQKADFAMANLPKEENQNVVNKSGVEEYGQEHVTLLRTNQDTPVLGQFPGLQKTASPSDSRTEQVCERWRLRGNQAYAVGDFSKAEKCYSRGVKCVLEGETSQSSIRASMLCYSNRAATRMAVGRVKDALADCLRGMTMDPTFVRVKLRAANCYLALGDIKSASAMLDKCLDNASKGQDLDLKFTSEVMEGAEKCKQAVHLYNKALEVLGKKSPSDLTTAGLHMVNKALWVCPYSEQFLELKAQLFFSLRRYDEAVQLCEQSLPMAEINHGVLLKVRNPDKVYNQKPPSNISNPSIKIWRWWICAKSYFHLGKLEESVGLIKKHEETVVSIISDKASSKESLTPLMSIINNLLHHKTAGNEAFQTGRHTEAVEHYTAALACNADSRPYNAVCFCNRAAAYQALGQIIDAIADCSRAIALDPKYLKALSRRATLHEMIRDFHEAGNDLRRLISLLEGLQPPDMNAPSANTSAKKSSSEDLRQARARLADAKEELKKGYLADHYLILGVDCSCSVNEIKKAYRKAALKHHPDKAGQFLTRSDDGDDGMLWKEVGDEVRRDAERLFKMIGEAYGVLSDTPKKIQYDGEEENRKARASSCSSSASSWGAQYEKSSRQGRGWDGYASQYQRWQNEPDAAQPDTYARRSSNAANGSRTRRSGRRSANVYWD